MQSPNSHDSRSGFLLSTKTLTTSELSPDLANFQFENLGSYIEGVYCTFFFFLNSGQFITVLKIFPNNHHISLQISYI